MDTLVLSDLNLISLLDLGTSQNINNQNEIILIHYKEDVSMRVSKNHFYHKEISAS